MDGKARWRGDGLMGERDKRAGVLIGKMRLRKYELEEV